MKKKILLSFLIIVMLLTLSCFATADVLPNNEVANEEEVEELLLEENIGEGVVTTTLPENIGEKTEAGEDIFTVGANWDPEDVIENSTNEEFKLGKVGLVKPVGDHYFISDEKNKSLDISDLEFKGNVFALVEENLTITNTTINGDLFVLAKNVNIINSSITGSIFLISESVITNDLKVEEVYMISKTATIFGNINNEFKAISENIVLDCNMNAEVYIMSKDVEIGDNANLKEIAYIKYSENFKKSDKAVCARIEDEKIENKEINLKIDSIEESIKPIVKIWNSVATKIIAQIVLTILIYGFIVLFTANRFEQYNSNMTIKRFVFCILKGILWFVLVPLVALILIFASFGYLASIGMLILIGYTYTFIFAVPMISIMFADIIKNKTIGGKKHWLNLLLAIIISVLLCLLLIFTKSFIIWAILGVISLGIFVNFVLSGNRIIKKSKEVKMNVEQ